MVIVRDNGSGVLDGEYHEGDTLQALPDSEESALGGNDKKSYLIFKVPDPSNMAKVLTALSEPEYQPGPTASQNSIKRARRYTLDWRSRFTIEEQAIIEDGSQILPDGELSGGGTVVSGVVYGKITFGDVSRK